jgi:hypothetical protein
VNTDAPSEAVASLGSEFGEPDAATWRKIVLRAVNAADADVEIELLRPVTWLEAQEAAVGAVIHVDLPELNTRGPARVLSVGPSPQIDAGPGTVVTGRFRHVANDLVDVHVEGLRDSIGCTDRHPFWSATRRQFVPANRLQIGELLLANTGQTARIVAVHFRPPREPVHNLEVLGPHVYHASELGLLVHNASWDSAPRSGLTTDQIRGLPGVAHGGEDLPNIVGDWLKDGAGPIPGQIAAKLRGQPFSSFKAFRERFWQLVEADPHLGPQFRAGNRGHMRKGGAPTAPPQFWVGDGRANQAFNIGEEKGGQARLLTDRSGW